MDRQIYTGRLTQKTLLSEREQCFHLEFIVENVNHFEFNVGQFISLIADDSAGKQQTRAYSIASAPRANRIALCVNRVAGGFFSNLLCDLEAGEAVQFHGPHGMFVLRAPLTDTLFVAAGTGIAPIRGFVEHLFPENGEDRSAGRNYWLLYGGQDESELYYQNFFEKVAGEHSNFHYLRTLSHPQQNWSGDRGYVEELLEQIAEQHARDNPRNADAEGFNLQAYICGLNKMVSACREHLRARGWQRKQIVFERYD